MTKDTNTGALKTQYQNFIHLSKYSRFDWSKQRRENWGETVGRWNEFFKSYAVSLVDDKNKKQVAAAVQECAEAIQSLRVVPSMRSLMVAGPALEKNHMAGYNCSFVAINRVQSFDEVLYILACGTGVGFSVERQHINQLPTVAEDFYPSDIVIKVPDSKEGWAKSLKELLSLLYQGQVPKWDTSLVRKKGAPLMTFGGRASGPEPLEKLFKFAVSLFNGAAGRKLTSLECHDLICKIADAIVSGGVRRSALISLSNLSDDRMRAAKMGDWYSMHKQREMANNSAVYTEKPDVGLFMQEWKALYDSKSGERGIFNRHAAKMKCESIGRNPDHEFGTNPCFTGDTLVWTAYGPKRFDALVGLKSVPVLTQLADGTIAFRDMINPRVTQRSADLVEVTVKTGPHSIHGRIKKSQAKTSTIKCTPDHMFFLSDGSSKRAADLAPGDSVYSCYQRKKNQKGYVELRGAKDTVSTAHAVLEWKYGRRPDYPKEHAHHLDDCKTNNDPDNLVIKDGSIHNRDHVLSDNNPMRKFPERNWRKRSGASSKENNGRWRHDIDTTDLRDAYDRLGSIAAVCREFKCTPPVVYKRLGLGQHAQNHTIVSVKTLDYKEDVYCGTVPSAGRFFVWCADDEGILVSNCGEIILRDRQLCNLSEVIIRPTDGMDELKEKVRLAAFIGTLQSTLTNFKYVSKKWRENCEEERLLGVSLTGIFDNPLTDGSQPGLEDRLAELRKVARDTDAKWAAVFKVPASAAITCVKPSGTASLLADCSSGIHPAFYPYYVRRARLSNTDPVLKMLRDAGVPTEPDNGRPETTSIVTFPIKSPTYATFLKDVRALDHLRLWKAYRDSWCDHNPSVSINVREDEWMSVGAWVYENFDSATGISFFPYADNVYDQAPYEEVTREQHDALLAAMPEIDWSKIADYENEDMTESAQNLACASPEGCAI